MSEYYVAWWNVENLLDIESQTDPAHRPEWLQKEYKSGRYKGDLKGWTATRLKKKIAQLARIVKQMNNGAGPDILGICEVENARVVDMLRDAIALPGRTYATVHHDMSDKRGIDIAFIYDSKVFDLEKKTQFHHVVQSKLATRELYQISLLTKGAPSRKLVLIGNHWPSRLGPEWSRFVAGATLGYWIERVHEVVGDDAAILAMGDFNDEPFNTSLVDFVLSHRKALKVRNATKTHYMYNPMWDLLGQGITSYVYSGRPNMLDQFLLSRGLLKSDGGFRFVDGSTEVLRFPEMVSGSYKKPKRFGLPARNGFNENGFSDHFPIALRLKLAS